MSESSDEKKDQSAQSAGDVDAFLAGSTFAVVGASGDRSKFGNKVFRAYRQQGRTAHPVNPSAEEIEGVDASPNLSAIAVAPHGVSIVTPPEVTDKVVDEAIKLGIRHLWMQPGAESPAAVRKAKDAGINVISGGPCVLVEFGFDG